MKGLFVIILMALLIVLVLHTIQHKKTGEDDVTPLAAIDRAKLMTIDTTVRNISTALNSYYSQHNEYPGDLTALIPFHLRTEQEITDPWGTRFRLETDDESELVAVSAGHDMEFDTDDDIRRRIE